MIYVLIPVGIAVIAFDVFCLVDLGRADQVRNLPKWVWVPIICLSTPWGGLAYLTFGRAHSTPGNP